MFSFFFAIIFIFSPPLLFFSFSFPLTLSLSHSHARPAACPAGPLPPQPVRRPATSVGLLHGARCGLLCPVPVTMDAAREEVTVGGLRGASLWPRLRHHLQPRLARRAASPTSPVRRPPVPPSPVPGPPGTPQRTPPGEGLAKGWAQRVKLRKRSFHSVEPL
jgi:hypothetical protein